MLKRPAESDPFNFDTRFAERITLAPGETEKARFKAWLAGHTAELRFCHRHARTRLVVDRQARRIWPAYKERQPSDYNPWAEPQVEPGVFEFRAELCCPACRAAHALCPPEFHESSFETFATDTKERAHTLARCRQFVEQVNLHGCGFMLMVGLNGNGKTRLACNVVRALDDGDALYVRQGELTTALRATYGHKEVIVRKPRARVEYEDTPPPSPLEAVEEVRFLVLDEIGCNALANDERLLLDELLKRRYDERKPTILISNLPLKELKAFLGDALADRITHATGNGRFILQFSGESFRRAAGEDYLSGLSRVQTSESDETPVAAMHR